MKQQLLVIVCHLALKEMFVCLLKFLAFFCWVAMRSEADYFMIEF